MNTIKSYGIALLMITAFCSVKPMNHLVKAFKALRISNPKTNASKFRMPIPKNKTPLKSNQMRYASTIKPSQCTLGAKHLPFNKAILITTAAGTSAAAYSYFYTKKNDEIINTQTGLACLDEKLKNKEIVSDQDIITAAHEFIHACKHSSQTILPSLFDHDYLWMNRTWLITIFSDQLVSQGILNFLSENFDQNIAKSVSFCARVFGNEHEISYDPPRNSKHPAILNWHIFEQTFSDLFIKNASAVATELSLELENRGLGNTYLEKSWVSNFFTQLFNVDTNSSFLTQFFNKLSTTIKDFHNRALSVEELNTLHAISKFSCLSFSHDSKTSSTKHVIALMQNVFDASFQLFLKAEIVPESPPEEVLKCRHAYVQILWAMVKDMKTSQEKEKFLGNLVEICRAQNKLVDDIITIFDSVDTHFSHSSKHFKIYFLSFLKYFIGYSYKNVYTPQLTQAIHAMVKNEIDLRSQGYSVFYHAQLNHLLFYEQLATLLYSKTQHKNIENFLLLHIREPIDEKQDNQLRKAILAGTTKHEQHRPRILFLNASIFGNLSNIGSYSVFYAGTNWNVHPPEFNAQEMFTWYKVEDLYTKYEHEINNLALESQQLSQHGTFVQIAVPDNVLDSSVYLSTSGGAVQKAEIIDDFGAIQKAQATSQIIQAYYKDPLKVRYDQQFMLDNKRTSTKSDHFEFCATMTHDKKGWLNPDSGIHMFTHRPVEIEKLQAFEAKQKDLFERIGRDIEKIMNQKN